MPSSSAARITSVPLGTVISKPSMVTLTPPAGLASDAPELPGVWTVIGASLSGSGEQRGRRGVERAAAALAVLEVLIPEVLDRRHHRADGAVTERAERAAQDVVTDVEQLVQVVVAAQAPLQVGENLHHPEGALAARCALAARLVLVELRPAQRGADDAGGLVEDLQGLGAEHGPRRAHRLEVQRHVQVLVG